MSTLGMVQLLYASLALVMGGLGLSLRPQDFRALRYHGRSVAVALVVQMALMPLIALGLISLFHLSGLVAVGILLLAATPGSISANLFSHLFGGNVAFNIALTGLNTFLCALTLPLIGTWALGHFAGESRLVPILLDNALRTVGLVVVPVILGMAIAWKAPRVAAQVNKPVKILSAAVVIVFSVAAIAKEWVALAAGFGDIGAAILSFNLASVAVSYGLARASGVAQRETITITFQVSVHNAIQAIYVALAVLNEPLAALPAAVYSISMNLFALAFGLLFARGRARRELGSPLLG
jgi:BASS family bile acid:Na+ symporter